MQMCPYCGEDVPDGAGKCWSCGSEVASDGEPGEGLQERRAAPGGECPHCGAVIAARALRCNECGRALTAVTGRRDGAAAMWGAFALVVLALVIGLVYALASGKQIEHDPARERPLDATYEHLIRTYRGRSLDSAELRRVWEDHHQGKFVRWEQHVLRLDPDGGAVELASRDDAERPEARVTFIDPEQLAGLRQRMYIRYTARLVGFEGDVFILDDGLLDPNE